jgi:tripartite-type tricarboxylate transporter receptor subunit TctC
MHKCRRLVLSSLALAALALGGLGLAPTAAQPYPSKPVKMIVPFPPGGTTDLIARMLANQMKEKFGQPVIIDNRGGAGGKLGLEIASKSPNDGYTVVFGSTSSLVLAAALYPSLPYDPIKSFEPISRLVTMPMVVAVHSSVPARTLKELIDLAKTKPGALNFGSVGPGTGPHISGEQFKLLTGIDIVHVPYKGSALSLAGLLGGEVQISIDLLASLQLPNFESGKIRALAIAGPARIPQLPQIPTTAEAGLPGFEVVSWFGLFAPSGTPADIVARLNAATVEALAAKEIADALVAQGLTPAPSTPKDLAGVLQADIEKWTRVVKASGIKVD